MIHNRKGAKITHLYFLGFHVAKTLVLGLNRSPLDRDAKGVVDSFGFEFGMGVCFFEVVGIGGV